MLRVGVGVGVGVGFAGAFAVAFVLLALLLSCAWAPLFCCHSPCYGATVLRSYPGCWECKTGGFQDRERRGKDWKEAVKPSIGLERPCRLKGIDRQFPC